MLIPVQVPGDSMLIPEAHRMLIPVAHPTMAPRKHLPKTAEAARTDGCNLLTDFFKRARPGRPKKRRNSAKDCVQAQPAISNKKRKRGPIPKEKGGPIPNRKMI
jgi:hypothetical protein